MPRKHGSGPLRVLVVDTTEETALWVRLGGYEVRTAFTGLDALTVARRYRPDAVLLSLGLPGLDGYEVARQLQLERGLGRPLLVALTDSGEHDPSLILAAGFDFHFAKAEVPLGLQRVLARRCWG